MPQAFNFENRLAQGMHAILLFIFFFAESVRHRQMNFNERRLYRERFPHVAPEVSDGKKPSQSSDIYSFGHMYCLTMKAMKDVLGTQEKQLLELGKQISHFRPHKRPNIAMVLEKLAIFSSSYPE